MIETTSTARGFSAWRVLVIAMVAALAIGIGAVAASFLVSARSIGAGPAAAYVPADAPIYFEWRVIPSAEQDAALRSVLSRFPIPGFDPDQPIADQLTSLLDDQLAVSAPDFNWSEDVATWFDGRIAFAVTDASFASSTMSQTGAAPEGLLFLVGVTDAAAAEGFINELRAEAGAQEFTSVDHGGTTIWTAGGAASYAVTSDQLIVAATPDDVADALDRAGGGDSFVNNQDLGRLSTDLPEDWLLFGLIDNESMLNALRDEALLTTPEMAPLFDVMEGQSTRIVMSVVATADSIDFESASTLGTGVFAAENGQRELASQVPGDVLVFADGTNIGPLLAHYIASFKAAAAEDPALADGVDQAEGVLGADLEDVVSWIDDGAIAIGYDGAEPYGGLILTATDADAAQTRIEGLLSLARLSVMDPTLGVTVSDAMVGDVEVTTIRWEGQTGLDVAAMPVSGASLQVAIDGDRVLLGVGESFVQRVLELDAADSLAQNERFAAAIDELGGTTNASTTWFDLRGTREAIEAAVPPEMLSGFVNYEADVKPWLVPFDYVAGVSRVDGDRLVSHMVVSFE